MLNIWTLTLLFFLYSVVSIVLFTLTSGGWTGLIYIFYLPVFYLVILLTLFIVSIIKTSKKNPAVNLSKNLLIIQSLSQIIYMIFNTGDCGDASGNYVFIERILFPSSSLCSTDTLFSSISGYILIPLALIYIISILKHVLNILIQKNTSPNSSLPLNSPKTILKRKHEALLIIFFSIALIIVCFFGFNFFAYGQNFSPLVIVVLIGTVLVVAEGVYFSSRIGILKTLLLCGTTTILTIAIFIFTRNFIVFQKQVSCLEGNFPQSTYSSSECIRHRYYLTSLDEIINQCNTFSEDKYVQYVVGSYHQNLLPRLSHRDFCYLSYAETYRADSVHPELLMGESGSTRPADNVRLIYRAELCKLLSDEPNRNACLNYFIEYLDIEPGVSHMVKDGYLNRSELIKPLCNAISHTKPSTCLVN